MQIRKRYTVRIADTKDGLAETARVGRFEMIQDIYVWNDKLVVLEPGWAENASETDTERPQRTQYSDEEDGGGFVQLLKDGLQGIFAKMSSTDTDIAEMDDMVSGSAYIYGRHHQIRSGVCILRKHNLLFRHRLSIQHRHIRTEIFRLRRPAGITGRKEIQVSV